MTAVLAVLVICVGCLLWCAAAALVEVFRFQSRRDVCACGSWGNVGPDDEIRNGDMWHSRQRCQPSRERVA